MEALKPQHEDPSVATSVLPDLKISPRSGYLRGKEGYEQIIRAAYNILIEQGSSALTMRRIAAECGLQAGNLAYYFKSKDELIRDLLNAIIGGYEEVFESIAHEPGSTAQKRLERLVYLTFDDITSKRTTRIFPELWAMSNHSEFVAERVDELYVRARRSLADLISELNPSLSKAEVDLAALFISASMEGMTIFAGFGKPWIGRMDEIKRLAIRSFLRCVEELQPGDLSGKQELKKRI